MTPKNQRFEPILIPNREVGLGREYHVFTDHQEPPRYALIHITPPTFQGFGPMGRAELEAEAQATPIDPASQARFRQEAGPFRVDGLAVAPTIIIQGEYPGGPRRAAQNLAKLILGG
jgi:hypothetical protein